MTADLPKRIQRQRTKGWRMPEGAIYVGRPTIWGNPWRPGVNCDTATEAVELYRQEITQGAYRRQLLWKLRGLDLCCWCRLDQPCHADVLLELANR